MRRALLAFLFLLCTGCGKGEGGAESGTALSGPKVQVLDNRVLLSWTAGSGLPDGYLVEESTDNSHWTQILDVTETSAYVDGLGAGVTHYFRLRTYNSAGRSAYSDSVSISL